MEEIDINIDELVKDWEFETIENEVSNEISERLETIHDLFRYKSVDIVEIPTIIDGICPSDDPILSYISCFESVNKEDLFIFYKEIVRDKFLYSKLLRSTRDNIHKCLLKKPNGGNLLPLVNSTIINNLLIHLPQKLSTSSVFIDEINPNSKPVHPTIKDLLDNQTINITSEGMTWQLIITLCSIFSTHFNHHYYLRKQKLFDVEEKQYEKMEERRHTFLKDITKTLLPWSTNVICILVNITLQAISMNVNIVSDSLVTCLRNIATDMKIDISTEKEIKYFNRIISYMIIHMCMNFQGWYLIHCNMKEAWVEKKSENNKSSVKKKSSQGFAIPYDYSSSSIHLFWLNLFKDVNNSLIYNQLSSLDDVDYTHSPDLASITPYYRSNVLIHNQRVRTVYQLMDDTFLKTLTGSPDLHNQIFLNMTRKEEDSLVKRDRVRHLFMLRLVNSRYLTLPSCFSGITPFIGYWINVFDSVSQERHDPVERYKEWISDLYNWSDKLLNSFDTFTLNPISSNTVRKLLLSTDEPVLHKSKVSSFLRRQTGSINDFLWKDSWYLISLNSHIYKKAWLELCTISNLFAGGSIEYTFDTFSNKTLSKIIKYMRIGNPDHILYTSLNHHRLDTEYAFYINSLQRGLSNPDIHFISSKVVNKPDRFSLLGSYINTFVDESSSKSEPQFWLFASRDSRGNLPPKTIKDNDIIGSFLPSEYRNFYFSYVYPDYTVGSYIIWKPSLGSVFGSQLKEETNPKEAGLNFKVPENTFGFYTLKATIKRRSSSYTGDEKPNYSFWHKEKLPWYWTKNDDRTTHRVQTDTGSKNEGTHHTFTIYTNDILDLDVVCEGSQGFLAKNSMNYEYPEFMFLLFKSLITFAIKYESISPQTLLLVRLETLKRFGRVPESVLIYLLRTYMDFTICVFQEAGTKQSVSINQPLYYDGYHTLNENDPGYFAYDAVIKKWDFHYIGKTAIQKKEKVITTELYPGLGIYKIPNDSTHPILMRPMPTVEELTIMLSFFMRKLYSSSLLGLSKYSLSIPEEVDIKSDAKEWEKPYQKDPKTLFDAFNAFLNTRFPFTTNKGVFNLDDDGKHVKGIYHSTWYSFTTQNGKRQLYHKHIQNILEWVKQNTKHYYGPNIDTWRYGGDYTLRDVRIDDESQLQNSIDLRKWKDYIFQWSDVLTHKKDLYLYGINKMTGGMENESGKIPYKIDNIVTGKPIKDDIRIKSIEVLNVAQPTKKGEKKEPTIETSNTDPDGSIKIPLAYFTGMITDQNKLTSYDQWKLFQMAHKGKDDWNKTLTEMGISSTYKTKSFISRHAFLSIPFFRFPKDEDYSQKVVIDKMVYDPLQDSTKEEKDIINSTKLLMMNIKSTFFQYLLTWLKMVQEQLKGIDSDSELWTNRKKLQKEIIILLEKEIHYKIQENEDYDEILLKTFDFFKHVIIEYGFDTVKLGEGTERILIWLPGIITHRHKSYINLADFTIDFDKLKESIDKIHQRNNIVAIDNTNPLRTTALTGPKIVIDKVVDDELLKFLQIK